MGHTPETYDEKPHVAPADPPQDIDALKWECLTCGKIYEDDHGVCPEDGSPLRKIGPTALGEQQTEKMNGSDGAITEPPSRPQDTPEGFKGAKEGSKGEESEDPRLHASRPADDRTLGGTT